MKTDFDVLIIGGGLVGMTAGLACAQAGFRVAIADIKPPIDQLDTQHDGRSSAIAAASFKMMQALGVASRLIEGENTHAGPINKILISDGDAGETPSPLTLFFDGAQIKDEVDAGAPLGYMVENRRMRLALYQQVKAADNIKWIAPAKLTGFDTEPANMTAYFDGGTTVTAKLIVGADGKNSAVRRMAGIESENWPCHQNGIVTTVSHELPHEGVAHELFLPSGPFAILPLTGNRASIVWTDTPRAAAAAMALDDAAFEAELARRFGSFLVEVKVIAPRWSYPLTLHQSDRYIGERLALVGDAAHGMHPIAGQGLNLGLRDVAALAEVIIDAARLGLDTGTPNVLEKYEQWRRFDSVTLLAITDGLNRLFTADVEPIRLARDVGLAAVNKMPRLKGFFMEHARGTVGEMPRLLAGKPL